jgi:hypothetical protein
MARNLSIRTEPPEVLPDDTLETHYAGLERMRPHGCYEGWVYVGFEGEVRTASSSRR